MEDIRHERYLSKWDMTQFNLRGFEKENSLIIIHTDAVLLDVKVKHVLQFSYTCLVIICLLMPLTFLISDPPSPDWEFLQFPACLPCGLIASRESCRMRTSAKRFMNVGVCLMELLPILSMHHCKCCTLVYLCYDQIRLSLVVVSGAGSCLYLLLKFHSHFPNQ